MYSSLELTSQILSRLHHHPEVVNCLLCLLLSTSSLSRERERGVRIYFSEEHKYVRDITYVLVLSGQQAN